MEGLQDWPSIFSAALDCDHLFDKCITQIQEPRINSLLGESTVAIGRLTRDHQARFQAWSSYLGVFAEHNVCLDHRLSNSKDVQVMVLDLIRIIAVNLRHFSSLVQISEDVLDHANNLATDLGQAQESIEGAIDRLHRLGVTIRQSSTASLISRVKAFSAKRSDPSLEEISYLMMKYLYPTASLSLQRLLGRSILERFFNLKYREEHQRRLATRRSIVLDGEEHQPQVHNKSHNGGLELPGLTFGKDYVNEFADRVADSDAMLSQSGTKPSTLQADEFKRKTEAGNQYAALSVISRTSSVPIGDISYPKPPKPIGNGEFSWAICSWCSESHPYGYFQDERWWRRHVDHDFRPYVCLFDTCPASLNGFAKFSPWLQHMEERHSTNWVATIDSKTLWRCDIEHNSPELFVNEASLRDHMREYHLESFTESQLVGIARRSSIRIPGSKDVCPLCGFDASKSPRGADQSNVSQQSWLNKRKRGSKHGPRANVNSSVQAKRRKVHFHDQAESSGHEPCSSSESDLDLIGDPGTEPISPHIDARLKRKQLSRHMATHLKALAFMSLRLKAFQEQSEERDQGSTSGDEQEETNEGGEPSGFDTELEALSLSFSDNPSFSVYPTDDLTTVDDRDDTDDIDDLIKDLHASSPPRRPDTLFHNSSIAYRELDFDGLDGLDEPDVSGVSKRSGNEYFGLPHLWSVTREDILEHQKSATPGPASQPSSTYAVVDGLQTHSGFGTETVPSSFLPGSANPGSTQDSRDGSPNLEPPWLEPGYS